MTYEELCGNARAEDTRNQPEQFPEECPGVNITRACLGCGVVLEEGGPGSVLKLGFGPCCDKSGEPYRWKETLEQGELGARLLRALAALPKAGGQ